MKKIVVLHGPNLNRLGIREPAVYGMMSLADLDGLLMKQAAVSGVVLTSRQSNSEAELIDFVHRAADEQCDFFIINPAAFTHTSIALRDALLATAIPFIEVHITNIYAREKFRRQSYFSDIALGVISGFGIQSYALALQAITEFNY